MVKTAGPTPRFIIDNWAAWSSDLETEEEWDLFFGSQAKIADEQHAKKADVEFLPAMQRRRLSSLARAVFRVAHQCVEGNEDIPSVFCSHYGELRRTNQILNTIASGAEVSPLAFSLSVHNAISGQHSILFKNIQPTTSLAPAGDGYLSAFAEALGILTMGAEAVLVVCYEDSIPEFYEPYISSVASPTAIAIRLRMAQSEDLRRYKLDFARDMREEPDLEIPLLALIRFFVQKRQCVGHEGWRLTTA